MEFYVRLRQSCRSARSTKISEGINRGTIASPHHAKASSPPILAKIVASGPFLNRKIAAHSINPSGLFILARDQAFFKTLFFSGDRGSDLGMVKTEEILRFPQNNGLLFNHVWGKTLRDGASNVFGIRRHLNPEVCPVKAIETYVAVASELRISATNGYLFRPTNPH